MAWITALLFATLAIGITGCQCYRNDKYHAPGTTWVKPPCKLGCTCLGGERGCGRCESLCHNLLKTATCGQNKITKYRKVTVQFSTCQCIEAYCVKKPKATKRPGRQCYRNVEYHAPGMTWVEPPCKFRCKCLEGGRVRYRCESLCYLLKTATCGQNKIIKYRKRRVQFSTCQCNEAYCVKKPKTKRPAKTFRWCAYEKEMKKCEEFVKIIPKLANAINVKGIKPGKCIKITSDKDCMKKIKANKADFITLDGRMVIVAGRDYALVPVVGEVTDGSLGYYGVAVANKESKVTLKTLKGNKTCHTGYRTTTGWNLPVGWLLRQDGFRQGCGDNIDAQSASKYFNESCVPGAPSGYSNLCALCPDKSCKKDGNEYSGYTGAFNCMKDGKGDVAFVDHLTTKEVVGQNTSGYKYLCTDGTSKEVTPTSHLNCNFAKSVSHTVVARRGDNKDYIKILVQAGKDCTKNTAAAKCDGFDLFESKKYSVESSNLLFKDSATELKDVGSKHTYIEWLGYGYVKDLKEVKKKDPVCAIGSILVGFPSLILTMFALVKYLI